MYTCSFWQRVFNRGKSAGNRNLHFFSVDSRMHNLLRYPIRDVRQISVDIEKTIYTHRAATLVSYFLLQVRYSPSAVRLLTHKGYQSIHR